MYIMYNRIFTTVYLIPSHSLTHSQHAGDLEKNVNDYDQTVTASLQSCSIQIAQNRAKVLELLLESVKQCDPHIHPNAALKLQKKKKAAA